MRDRESGGREGNGVGGGGGGERERGGEREGLVVNTVKKAKMEV